MSQSSKSQKCIRCGRKENTEFQEVFDEIGMELKLDALIEHNFGIKVVHSPCDYQVLCSKCINQLIELVDVAEKSKIQSARKLSPEPQAYLYNRINHIIDSIEYNPSGSESSDDFLLDRNDQVSFKYEIIKTSSLSRNTVKTLKKFDHVKLEQYADGTINSNLEELQLQQGSTCSVCSLYITNHQSLLSHIIQKHKREKGFYPCVLNNCQDVFENERHLARHIVLKHYDLRDIPIFGSCQDCGITFSNFLDFNKHSCCTTVKHRGKSPNYCDICNMIFPTFRRFRFHKQFHLEKRRPKVCLLCDRFFSDGEEFFEHVYYSHEPENRLICKKCDRSFRNQKLFNSHMETHNLELTYKCTSCPKAFSQKNRLKSHIESYHKKKALLKCEFCSKILSNKDYFRNHMKLHHSDIDVHVSSCTTCGLIGRDKEELQRHCDSADSKCFKAIIEQEFLSEAYLCEFCDAIFKTKEDLKQHRATGVHLDKIFHCALCPATYDELRKVRAHFKSHKLYDDWQKSLPLLRMYMCDVGNCTQSYAMWVSLYSHKALKHKEMHLICTGCGRQFKTKTDLDGHTENCRKSKIYTCQFCSKECKSKMSLSMHIARSHNNKNVTCPTCKASFKDQRTLQSHTEFVHVQMECMICNKTVKNMRNLRLHERVKHKNEKRYFCESCGKGFYNKSDMEAHRKTAHPETSYACVKCSFVTNYKNSFDVHMAMHNKDLQFKCPICGRHFARKRVMDLHIKRHQQQREFVCSDYVTNGCFASFVTRFLLNKHIKEKHTNRKLGTANPPTKRCRPNKKGKIIAIDVESVIDTDDPKIARREIPTEFQAFACYEAVGKEQLAFIVEENNFFDFKVPHDLIIECTEVEENHID